MEYMFLITTDESQRPAPEDESREPSEAMAAWLAYNQKLVDGGHWIAGAGLQPSETATVVRKADGVVVGTTDGPYTETKEQVGGFYLVKAADLDQALALANEIPIPWAVIEVRPVMFRADA